MKALLIRSVVASIVTLVFAASPAVGQEMVDNGGFEEEGGWTIYDMGSTDLSTYEVTDDPDLCPTNGEGNCLVLSGESTYTNTLVWQALSLRAGTPYLVDAEFRQLGDTLIDSWTNFYMSLVEPTMGVDYTQDNDVIMAFNTWAGCGNGIDGKFSEFGCEGKMDNLYIPPGTPGEEVIVYIGIKSGVAHSPAVPFAISIDNVSAVSVGEAFAIASFTRDPLYRVPVNYPVSFDGTASEGSSEIAEWAWDFGDGGTATGSTPTHTFTEIGTFTVSLTVTGSDGGIGTISRNINVFEGTGSEQFPLEIPRAGASPAIDGEVDAVWDEAQVVEIATRASGSDPTDAADLSGVVRLLWDVDNLYALFQVRDDDLQKNSNDAWQDDGVELYIDAGNEKQFEGYDGNDVQYTMNWDSAVFTGNGAGRTEGAAYVFETTDDGYVIEVVIPWSNVDLVPEVGMRIGFEAMINDDDAGTDTRDHKLAWYALPGVDNAHQHAHLFGTAVFVESLSTSAEPPSGIPGAFTIESVYPNPFNPSTTALISLQSAGQYSVRVFDLLGRLIQEQSLHASAPGELAVNFSLDDQASGMYVITVEHRDSGTRASARVTLVK